MRRDQNPANRTPRISLLKMLMLLVLITLNGCAIFNQPLAPDPPVLATKVAIPEAPKRPVPAPLPTPAIIIDEIAPLDTAIIISRDIKNHHVIHHKIEALIKAENGHAEPFYLYQSNAAEIIQQIKASKHKQVVAIGLAAAKAASQLQQMPVVFCQVYNYQDHHLITDYIKGVSLIPAIDRQFEAWKMILPELKQVGFITGNGKTAFTKQATERAAAYGVTLVSRVVNNDKEMWREFRRLTAQVDGFWLLPDNRILSKRTLRSMMSYSAKHAMPLFTTNGLLLRAGAAISATQYSDDVAHQVVKRLRATAPDNTIPGADIAPLEQARIFINTQTVKRFNLLTPENSPTINFEWWPSTQVNATLVQ